MKATPARYFFARPWPWIILFWGVPLLVIFIFGDEAYLHHQSVVIESLFGSGVGLGLVFGVLSPFKKYCGKKNGAPFGIGDKVTILRGDDKGRHAIVHQVWPQTRHVRVRLDSRPTDAADRIFTYLEVLANHR